MGETRSPEYAKVDISEAASLTDYLVNASQDLWEKYIEHPFIVQLKRGTLPEAAFLHFVRQGYLYLLHYARTYALAAYKAKTFDDLATNMVVVQACIDEVNSNVQICKEHGISKEELEKTPPSLVNIAYSRYILDIANSGDLLDLKVVTMPCLLGYGDIGKRLTPREGARSVMTDRYDKWIQTFGQQEYQTHVLDAFENEAAKHKLSPTRLKELVQLFRQATELEIAFWDSALSAAS